MEPTASEDRPLRTLIQPTVLAGRITSDDARFSDRSSDSADERISLGDFEEPTDALSMQSDAPEPATSVPIPTNILNYVNIACANVHATVLTEAQGHVTLNFDNFKDNVDRDIQRLGDDLDQYHNDATDGNTAAHGRLAKLDELVDAILHDCTKNTAAHIDVATTLKQHKKHLVTLLTDRKTRPPPSSTAAPQGLNSQDIAALLAPMELRLQSMEKKHAELSREVLELRRENSDLLRGPLRGTSLSSRAQQSQPFARVSPEQPEPIGQGGPGQSSATPNSSANTPTNSAVGSLSAATIATAPPATMAAFGGSQQKIDRQLVLPKLPEKERTISSDNDLQDVLAYHKWEQETTLALITGGLHVAITHQSPPQGDPAWAEYLSRSAHTYKALKAAAPTTLQRQIMGLQSDHNSALKAWCLIKDFYVRKGHTYNVALNNSLRALRPDKIDNMPSYLALAEETQGHFIIMSVPLEESLLVRAVYDGLVAHDPTWQSMYRDMVSSLGQENSWTWEPAKAFFQEQDDLRKLSAGPGSIVLPLGYSSPSAKPKPRVNRMTTPNATQDAAEDEEPGRHPLSGNLMRTDSYDDRTTCYSCNQRGHRSQNCPTIPYRGGGRYTERPIGRERANGSWSSKGRGNGAQSDNWRNQTPLGATPSQTTHAPGNPHVPGAPQAPQDHTPVPEAAPTQAPAGVAEESPVPPTAAQAATSSSA